MLGSWLFLVTSFLVLLLAGNVLRPPRAPGGLAIVGFFAGWLVGELAVHALVIDAVVAALFVALGALASWQGYLALVFTGVSWLLLLVALQHASRAPAAFDAALRDALGSDLDAPRSPEAKRWLEPASDWSRVALPFPVRHPQVERIHRVPFAGVDGITLHLDVHRHRTHRGPGPTIVYVHGGGWILGHRDKQGLPLLQHLAARGWVGFSVDYRLSPRATFPDHLVDVKRAIAWVREHAAEYGADPDFLVLAGNSAGGHLAALAALTGNERAYQPGFEQADTSVDACVAFYGVHDLLDRYGHWPHPGMRDLLEKQVMKTTREASPEAYDAGSPVARVHAGAPPFLLVHGDRDTMAPVQESRRLHEVLRSTSHAPAAYAELPGAQHAFEVFPSVRTTHALEGVTRFLAVIADARRLAKSSPRRSAKRSAPA